MTKRVKRILRGGLLRKGDLDVDIASMEVRTFLNCIQEGVALRTGK